MWDVRSRNALLTLVLLNVLGSGNPDAAVSYRCELRLKASEAFRSASWKGSQ